MNNCESLDINSTTTTKNKKFIDFEPSQSGLDKNDLYINDKVLNVTEKVNHNNTKKYESFNVSSETGDSIYSPVFEEITAVTKEKGQVFISIDKLNEMVQRELDKRFGKKEVVDI